MNDYKNLNFAYLEDIGYIKENFSGYIKENFEPRRLVQKITKGGNEIDINNTNTYGGLSEAAETFEFDLEFKSSGSNCPVIERNWSEWSVWGKNNYLGQSMQVSRCNDPATGNKCYIPEDTYYDSKGVKCKGAGAYWTIVATKKSNNDPCTIQFALNYGWYRGNVIKKDPVIDNLKYHDNSNAKHENALFHKYVYPSIPIISLAANKLIISSKILEMPPILDDKGTNKYSVDSRSNRYFCPNITNGPYTPIIRSKQYGIAKDGSIGCGDAPYNSDDWVGQIGLRRKGNKINTNCSPDVSLGDTCPPKNKTDSLSGTKDLYNKKQFISLSVPKDHPLCKYLKLTA